MKSIKSIYLLVSFLLLSSFSSVKSGAILGKIGLGAIKGDSKAVKLVTGVGEKQAQLEGLLAYKKGLSDKEDDFLASLKSGINNVNGKTSNYKNSLTVAPSYEHAFLNKCIGILSKEYQSFLNMQIYNKQLFSVVDQHIKLLNSYLKDSGFKSVVLDRRSVYHFSDLEMNNRKIFDQEDKLAHLTEQKGDATIDLENLKHKQSSTEAMLKEKEKDQKEFLSKKDGEDKDDESLSFSIKQQGEILDLEVELQKKQNNLELLKVEDAQQRFNFISTSIEIESERLSVLKDQRQFIKDSLQVDLAAIEKVEKELSDKKEDIVATQDAMIREITTLSITREKYKDKTEKLSEKYSDIKTDSPGADEWVVDPKTAEEYIALCEIGYERAQIDILNRKIELLRAKSDMQKSGVDSLEILVSIMKSWHKITTDGLKTKEEVEDEEKQYSKIKKEQESELSLYRDKRSTVTNYISIKNKTASNIKGVSKKLKEDKNTIFKQRAGDYNVCLNKITAAQKLVGDQIDLNAKLLEAYSKFISTIRETLQQVTAIVNELGSDSVWHRSSQAITLHDIKNIIPDIQTFLHWTYLLGASFISKFSIPAFFILARRVASHPLGLLLFILKLLALLFIFAFLRNYLSKLPKFLLKLKEQYHGLMFINCMLAVVIEFVEQNLLLLYGWGIFWVAISTVFAQYTFPRLVFYLFSIIYLSFFARKFVSYLSLFNKKHKYPIFSVSFQKKFLDVFSFFMYSTIVIFFFRSAFSTVMQHSGLCMILLALYSIIFRVLLILLIGKEEILSIIPTGSKVWNWLAEVVQDYYNIILFSIIVVMIMADPYVGGLEGLILYVLWGTIGTIVLAWVLITVHAFFRKLLAQTFFYSTPEEGLKPRFDEAKTMYSFGIVFLFAFFVALGALIGSYIWGKSISLTVIGSWFTQTNYAFQFGNETQKVSVLDFIMIISYIPFGFVISYLIDRFFLKRVFSVLHLEPGIHNTISSLLHYFVIVFVFIIGLSKEGFGSIIIYFIGPILLGLVLALKDVFNDLVAYFIILIQRPVKIGDFIVLTDGTGGVVRRITPRTVVLRRKDSYTLVVPNSKILQDVVSNWSYSRSYYAFDDILITVPYDSDVKKVMELLFEVLDENISILKSPKPIVRLNEFGECGLVFMLRAFVSSSKVLMMWDIMADVRLSVFNK
ncbi:mechanosensitive ion channel, partial [bacterium]|nr:mechanosensitive ion channel [bacterium]